MNTPDSVNDLVSRTVVCSHCKLRKLCLPKGLTKTEIIQLEGAVEQASLFNPGECLYEQGEPLRFLYIIRSGSAKSLVTAADGVQQIIGFHLPGELLGLDGLAQLSYTSSAVALNTTTVCALSYKHFDQLCTSIPNLHHEVLMEAARRLADDHDLLLAMGQKSADERVAIFLLDVSARMKARGLSETEFILCMSRSDLANYLGVAPATLSRILTRFKQEGFLTVNRRQIHITGTDQLQALIDHCQHCGSLLID